jgi:hypothetical protein
VETVGFDGLWCAARPDHLTERSTEIRDVVGITHLLCWTRLGGLAEEKEMGYRSACAIR